MKKYISEPTKENTEHINIFLMVVLAISLSKYIFEAGISVGKMFFRLM